MGRVLTVAFCIALAIVGGGLAQTGLAKPWGVSDAEMQRRYLVIAVMVITISLAGGVFIAAMEKLQGWIDRKRDPWRRLD